MGRQDWYSGYISANILVLEISHVGGINTK
jgi:hypothetical protein